MPELPIPDALVLFFRESNYGGKRFRMDQERIGKRGKKREKTQQKEGESTFFDGWLPPLTDGNESSEAES